MTLFESWPPYLISAGVFLLAGVVALFVLRRWHVGCGPVRWGLRMLPFIFAGVCLTCGILSELCFYGGLFGYLLTVFLSRRRERLAGRSVWGGFATASLSLGCFAVMAINMVCLYVLASVFFPDRFFAWVEESEIGSVTSGPSLMEEMQARAQSNTNWEYSAMSEEIPFSIGYLRTNAFQSEGGRQIRFKSGKTVELPCDTGGMSPIAVYRQSPVQFYLVDGYRVGGRIEHEIWVNTEKEDLSYVESDLIHWTYIGEIDSHGRFRKGKDPLKNGRRGSRR